MVSRKSPLLDPNESERSAPSLPSSSRLMFSFVMMSVCFSLNHGTVTALIALAAPSLGDLGRYCTGLLYIMYTFVALFLSNPLVDWLGHKKSLVAGLGVYCFYVCSFMAYHFLEGKAAKDSAAIIGSAIGGVAAGFLWTAQGGYFALACSMYSTSSGQTKEAVTSWFGSVFAVLYLFGEVGLKLASSGLQKIKNGGEETVFVTFSVVAVSSAIGMAMCEDLQKYERKLPQKSVVGSGTEGGKSKFLVKVMAAINLLLSDPKMALLIPTQLTFGVMSVFLNSYSNVNIVSDQLGSDYVGYCAAIVAATAAVLAMPMGWLTKRVSKMYMLTLGGLVFGVECVLFLLRSDEQLGNWSWCVLLYCMHGVGRSVWENTNKAVMADFFPNAAPAAFANVIWSSGGASSIGFFLFPNLSRSAQLWICLVLASTQILCSWMAFNVRAKEKQREGSEGSNASASIMEP